MKNDIRFGANILIDDMPQNDSNPAIEDMASIQSLFLCRHQAISTYAKKQKKNAPNEYGYHFFFCERPRV